MWCCRAQILIGQPLHTSLTCALAHLQITIPSLAHAYRCRSTICNRYRAIRTPHCHTLIFTLAHTHSDMAAGYHEIVYDDGDKYRGMYVWLSISRCTRTSMDTHSRQIGEWNGEGQRNGLGVVRIVELCYNTTHTSHS